MFEYVGSNLVLSLLDEINKVIRVRVIFFIRYRFFLGNDVLIALFTFLSHFLLIFCYLLSLFRFFYFFYLISLLSFFGFIIFLVLFVF
jgi:hypothetical protein